MVPFFKLKMHYDPGSQHTLASKAINKISNHNWKTGVHVQINTVNGSSVSKRDMAKIKLSETQEIEAFLVDEFKVEQFNMKIPDEWTKFKSDWCEPIDSAKHANIDAICLMGADNVTLMPIQVLDDNQHPIETYTDQ